VNLRYGVIAMDDLLRDLEHWETLLISSFMHRPFEVLESGSTESYDELMEKQLLNLRSAAAYSALHTFNGMTEHSFYENIV